MNLLIRLLLNALALLAVAYIVPGFEVNSFWTAVIVAIVLGFVNAVIKPILVIFTLPITILTLGLFTLIINAALLLLVAQFVPGFDIAGFWAAFWGSITLWVISWFTNAMTK